MTGAFSELPEVAAAAGVGADKDPSPPARVAGDAARGWAPKMSPIGLGAATTGTGTEAAVAANGSKPPAPGMGAAAAGAGAEAGGAEKMSASRSTSPAGAGADTMAAAVGAAAGGIAAPPLKMSSRSSRSPPPDFFAAMGEARAAGALPSPFSSPMNESLRSGARFLCINFRSTTGMRASASLAAACTSPLTAPPPSLTPSMSSLFPLLLTLTLMPLTALSSASYSHDLNCNSRE
mmetsp:Transcript_62379/g.184574  ORF Transcript_62379/g.184574 Transcript_62379/m.184574 type:complete len:235 (-) Transcript_62379:2048-2752(-)